MSAYTPVGSVYRLLMKMTGLYGLIVALITDTRANLVSSNVCYPRLQEILRPEGR